MTLRRGLHGGRRASARAIVLLIAGLGLPCVLVGLAEAARRGGLWLILAAPLAALLAGYVQAVARMPRSLFLQLAGNCALAFAVFALLGLAVGPELGLYRTVTVLSGSMRPTFDPGDVIVVTPEPARDLRLGQVITYQIPVGARQVESHRVVRILQHGETPIVQTRGDANSGLDPWEAELHGGTLWRFRFRIPMLGYPILALRTRMAHVLLVLVLPLVLAVYALVQLWRPRRQALPAVNHAQQAR